jgi:hypothetical protein
MRDVAVLPNKSDSEITMKINQWAADTYPSRKSTSTPPGRSRTRRRNVRPTEERRALRGSTFGQFPCVRSSLA